MVWVLFAIKKKKKSLDIYRVNKLEAFVIEDLISSGTG